ncbi:MAG: hydroxymethylbilane synthase [Chitinophagales bacterium]|nr:hydroxymethylbilane synthase [Chitinophagales bacterium]
MKGKTTPIIIGTRGSELALWQANYTKSVLAQNGFQAELKIIKTKGDATQQWNLSFDKLEGKGFFTKELEDALLANEIDMAVHSCKDMPTESPEGLEMAAYSNRANPFDLLLIRKECTDTSAVLNLKKNALVGTSSARRKAQLLALRPDLVIQDLRGNVPGRVGKLADKKYDAIVLASAGLERLNVDLSAFEQVALKAPMFIPAPAQGVLAFQIRENNTEMQNICKLLNDADSAAITLIERKILHDFEGGCQMPLGVYAEKIQDKTHVWISMAAAWDAFPKRLHYVFAPNELKNSSVATQQLVNQLKSNKTHSVFISSDLYENDYLLRALRAHQYQVNYSSLIEFSAIDFEPITNADWIFFSSKNGVKFYFNKVKKIPKGTKLAAVNQGTAQALLELGGQVDFVGSGGDIFQIAKAFDEVAYGKIIFPQAKKSLQSIQKGLTQNKDVHTLVVYDNQPKKEVALRKEAILVFTSPINAEAYFASHEVLPMQKIISIGNSTTKKLKELAIEGIHTAFEPTHWAILDELFF